MKNLATLLWIILSMVARAQEFTTTMFFEPLPGQRADFSYHYIGDSWPTQACQFSEMKIEEQEGNVEMTLKLAYPSHSYQEPKFLRVSGDAEQVFEDLVDVRFKVYFNLTRVNEIAASDFSKLKRQTIAPKHYRLRSKIGKVATSFSEELTELSISGSKGTGFVLRCSSRITLGALIR